MKRFFQVIERKPLALSVLALMVSFTLLAFICVPSYPVSRRQVAGDWGVIGSWCIAFCIALLALVALIRAERRGYSSTRIGLCVTALFFVFVPIILLAGALLLPVMR